MREEIRLSIAEIMKWDLRCLVRLCETTLQNNLSYRELLSVQLGAQKMTKREFEFCLFARELGQMILNGEVPEKKLNAAYRNFLRVSLEVSRIYSHMKLTKKLEERATKFLQYRGTEKQAG